MIATHRFDPVLVGRELHAIQAWLTKAGIDPNVVPEGAAVALDDKTMTVEVFLTRGGRKYLDESGNVARSTVTVPLLWPPNFESLIAIPAVPGGTT